MCNCNSQNGDLFGGKHLDCPDYYYYYLMTHSISGKGKCRVGFSILLLSDRQPEGRQVL